MYLLKIGNRCYFSIKHCLLIRQSGISSQQLLQDTAYIVEDLVKGFVLFYKSAEDFTSPSSCVHLHRKTTTNSYNPPRLKNIH